MIKQIIFLLSVAFIVTGCNLELKKSANNKLFDTKGFDGSKRKPLYNSKYIDRAKRNVVNHNYDEDNDMDIDEPDEYVDPYTQNRIMYSNMIKNEKSRKRKNRNSNFDDYPDIGHAKDIALSEENKSDSNAELKKELSEIRSMLVSAKKDLAKYKCPVNDPNPKPLSALPVKKKVDDANDIHTNLNQVQNTTERPNDDLVESNAYDQTHTQAQTSELKHPNNVHSVSDTNVQVQQHNTTPPMHSNDNSEMHHQPEHAVSKTLDHSMINLAPAK